MAGAGGQDGTPEADRLAPQTDDPYVVVPETGAFHGTLPTAQRIPDVDYAG